MFKFIAPLTFKRRNVIRFIQGISPYRAVNTFHHGYKNQSVNAVKAKVAICSDIHTKYSTQNKRHVRGLEF